MRIAASASRCSSLPRSSTWTTKRHGEPGSSSSYRIVNAAASPPRSTPVGVALADQPGEDAEADPVGRAAARPAADRPARADRVAVARLEVVAGDAPGHVVATVASYRSGMSIDPRVDIGHVHLKVADLDRALDVLARRARLRRHAPPTATGRVPLRRRLPPPHRAEHVGEQGRLAASRPGRPASTTSPIRYPDRRALADALQRLCSRPASSLAAHPITASARRSTCATRTATASSSTRPPARPVAGRDDDGSARRAGAARRSRLACLDEVGDPSLPSASAVEGISAQGGDPDEASP